MAVININKKYLEEKTKMKEEEIIETLNSMGYPTEIEEEVYVVEVTPDRPDMLGWNNVIKSILNYKNKKDPEIIKIKTPSEGSIKIRNEKPGERPFIAVAFVKEIKDREFLYESIIELQEKLDQTIGRNRKKLAIGIHDLDKIKFPLVYKEVKEEKFRALNTEEEKTIEEILNKTWQGEKYRHLVKKGKYPMLYDSEGVISFPPIINSERTKISENTKNFLIDITGTHEETVKYAMNIILSELYERGGEIYNVEGDEIKKMEYVEMNVELEKINKLLGMEVREEELPELFKKMGLLYKDKKILIPPYRVDFMDYSDVAEEIAIAIGYENIEPEPFNYNQEGETNEEENIIKEIFVGMGFNEVKTFFLVSEKELEKINEKQELKLVNALSEDFNTIRPTLKLNLIKTIYENKKEKLPVKFFEIGRVFDKTEETRLAFIIADEEVSINQGIKIIKRLEKELGLKLEIKNVDSDVYIKGRAFAFEDRKNKIKGVIGEVDPSINEKFSIDLPMLLCEMTLPL